MRFAVAFLSSLITVALAGPVANVEPKDLERRNPTTTCPPDDRSNYTGVPISHEDGPDKCCNCIHGPDEYPFFIKTEGEKRGTFSITIEPKDCCECAVLEYAFITEEVPGGFFGTQFNDFFEVSINSRGQNQAVLSSYVSNADSMNGLNLGAFNTLNPAATCCYVLNLNVKDRNPGLPIIFFGAVTNAVDPNLQSALCGKVYCADKDGKPVGSNKICQT